MFEKGKVRVRMPAITWQKNKKVVEITTTHFNLSKALYEEIGLVDNDRLGVSVQEGIFAFYKTTKEGDDPFMKVSQPKATKDYKDARSCQAKNFIEKIERYFKVQQGIYELDRIDGDFYVFKKEVEQTEQTEQIEQIEPGEEIFPDEFTNPAGVVNPHVK